MSNTVDLIKSSTNIETAQIEEAGTTVILEPQGFEGSFMLTDILISSTSSGQVTLIATDGINTHIIASINGKTIVPFTHAFEGGWTFWREAQLEIVKENLDGEVNIALGFVKNNRAQRYNQWRRK